MRRAFFWMKGTGRRLRIFYKSATAAPLFLLLLQKKKWQKENEPEGISISPQTPLNRPRKPLRFSWIFPAKFDRYTSGISFLRIPSCLSLWERQVGMQGKAFFLRKSIKLRGKDPRKPKRFSWSVQGSLRGNRNPLRLVFFLPLFLLEKQKKKWDSSRKFVGEHQPSVGLFIPARSIQTDLLSGEQIVDPCPERGKLRFFEAGCVPDDGRGGPLGVL